MTTPDRGVRPDRPSLGQAKIREAEGEVCELLTRGCSSRSKSFFIVGRPVGEPERPTSQILAKAHLNVHLAPNVDGSKRPRKPLVKITMDACRACIGPVSPYFVSA